jgi:L-fuculose-phosphate aldolase
MSPRAWDVREALCEVGRRVWQRGLVASNDGNFSFRLDEHRVLATPTLVSKGFMEPDDMVIVDLDGNLLEGTRRTTSEIRIHLNAYRRRPDIRSVVHVHPPHAVAFAIARRALPKCVLPEVEFFLGQVPLAPYETPGTWEFARSIDPWIAHHDVFLLANHGAVSLGADPFDAYYKMETLEQYCRILILARQLGADWNQLDAGQMRALLEAKASWGVADPRAGTEACRLCDPAVPAAEEPVPPPRFTAPLFNGAFPAVSDQPKPSSAPEPSARVHRGAPDRHQIEAVVREVLARVRRGG